MRTVAPDVIIKIFGIEVLRKITDRDEFRHILHKSFVTVIGQPGEMVNVPVKHSGNKLRNCAIQLFHREATTLAIQVTDTGMDALDLVEAAHTAGAALAEGLWQRAPGARPGQQVLISRRLPMPVAEALESMACEYVEQNDLGIRVFAVQSGGTVILVADLLAGWGTV